MLTRQAKSLQLKVFMETGVSIRGIELHLSRLWEGFQTTAKARIEALKIKICLIIGQQPKELHCNQNYHKSKLCNP